MGTTVENIEHWHRHQSTSDTADVLPKRQFVNCCACMKTRQGCTEHGIGAEVCFVWGSIQFDHDFINDSLLIHWKTDESFLYAVGDVVNGRLYAFSKVACSVTIPHF